MKPAPSQAFQYIQESNDQFLALWTHRYDYIWAPHPDAGHKPNWQTESRYPLGDRLIQQGSTLYGVRFGTTTDYTMLDIDIASLYHPRRDPYAIYRILEALEPLGLVSYVACTSSYSGGLHLYFPFSAAFQTWEIALAITTLLENAGLKVAAGQLEVFPNAKPYATQGTPNLYAAHRLPLRAGSYLLDQQWQSIWSDQATFVSRWQFAQARNDITAKKLKRVLKQYRRKVRGISTKADKFLNDLNTEIEAGWTGAGQTNYILGRIAMRDYIFGHVLYAHEPLEGQALVDSIINTAKALPGYSEFCGHQHDLEKKAEGWARCIEASRYFHYGTPQGKYKAKKQTVTEPGPEKLSVNELRKLDARERIRLAVADLLNQGTLPAGITARKDAIVRYHISPSTLYKHKDLWFPTPLWKTPPDPHTSIGDSEPDQESGSEIHPSLLGAIACNEPNDKASSHLEACYQLEIGCNSPADEASSDSEEVSGPDRVKQVLDEIKARRQADRQKAGDQPQVAQENAPGAASQPPAAQVERMQRYLDSGDPILMAEAMEWAKAYPGFIF